MKKTIILLIFLSLSLVNIVNAWSGNYASWDYRTNITIINENYTTSTPIKLILNSSVFEYDLSNINGADLRFTLYNYTNNSEIPLNYYLKDWEVNGTSIVYVNVTELTTSLNTIFLYQTKTAKTNESNSSKVFLYFDDFSSNTTQNYNFGQGGQGGVWSIDNNILTMDASSGASATLQLNYTKNISIPSNFTIEYQAYGSTWDWVHYGSAFFGLITNFTGYQMSKSNTHDRSRNLYYNNSLINFKDLSGSVSTYDTFWAETKIVTVLVTNEVIREYINSSLNNTNTTAQINFNLEQPGFQTTSDQYGDNVIYEYAFIAKGIYPIPQPYFNLPNPKLTITLNDNNGFNINNYSMTNQYDNILPINITFTANDLVNITINITRNSVTYYNFSNNSISGLKNYTKTFNVNTSGWDVGVYDINIILNGTVIYGKTASTQVNSTQEYYSWYRGASNITNPDAFSNEPTTLTLNLTNHTTITNITANLIYNATQKNGMTKESFMSSILLSNTFFASTTNGTIPFYWNVTITQGDGNTSNFNVSGNQTVKYWGVGNCTTYNATTLILSIYDEEYPTTLINATVDVQVNYWINNRSNFRNYTAELVKNHTYKICLSPRNISVYTDSYFKYTTTNGFTHRYYLVNETLTNTTKTFNIYNFNTTTGISNLKITARDTSTYEYYKNVIAQLQRLYVGEGVWRTVQMDESGDYGTLFFNIKEETTDYKIIYKDRNNNILKTTESIKLICTAAVCELTYMLDPYAAISITTAFQASMTYDNNTNIISVQWGDITGVTQSMRLQVSKDAAGGTLYICNTTQTGNSGTITCDTTGYDGSVRVALFNTASPERPRFAWLVNLQTLTIESFLGRENAGFWAFGIMVTIIGFGMFSPAGAVISTVLGLFTLSMLGLISGITTAMVLIAGVMGLIISLKVKQ